MKILILGMSKKPGELKLALISIPIYFIIVMIIDVLLKAFAWEGETAADAFKFPNLIQWFIWAVVMSFVMIPLNRYKEWRKRKVK